MRILKRFFRKSSPDIEALRASPYFDAAWYLLSYADVRAADVDPARHYLEFGARERRDPGPRFSSAEYLKRNPHVEAAGENPVLHFMRNRQPGEEPPLPDYVHRPGSSGAPFRHGPLVDPVRDRELNRREAAANAAAVESSRRAIDALLAALPVDPAVNLTDPVPCVFHFVFGFKSGGDIPYYGYLAIRSALHFNPGWRAIYYTMHEPAGPNWNRIKDQVTLIRIGDFDYFRTARVHHYAHKADVIRLLVINRIGGVYLDLDTITQRSFEDLRGEEFVMGVQSGGPDSSSGMANAVLIGKPGARFSTHWIEQYDYFRSRGRDDLWDYHSVKMPVHMMAQAPETIRIVDYRAFFYPLWHVVEQQLFTDRAAERFGGDFDTAYCFHLWNGISGPFLETLDETFVRTSRSIYAGIARQVEGIPEPTRRTASKPSPNAATSKAAAAAAPRDKKRKAAVAKHAAAPAARLRRS